MQLSGGSAKPRAKTKTRFVWLTPSGKECKLTKLQHEKQAQYVKKTGKSRFTMKGEPLVKFEKLVKYV
jgi:hypothetical protein